MHRKAKAQVFQMCVPAGPKAELLPWVFTPFRHSKTHASSSRTLFKNRPKKSQESQLKFFKTDFARKCFECRLGRERLFTHLWVWSDAPIVLRMMIHALISRVYRVGGGILRGFKGIRALTGKVDFKIRSPLRDAAAILHSVAALVQY